MAEALGFSAVTKLVSLAVGLLGNKVYDGVTNQLKDGDVAKESLHDKIVRDLNDIKSTLECLSLKDLDTSYSFLKEGVQLLNLAIDSPSKGENDNLPGQGSRISENSASGILKEASSLCKAMRGLKIFSQKRFLCAEGRFRASREEATRAFNTKSLSTANRIMACKLRVAATILESGLEDPQAAVAACLVSLKELHGLPQIQDMLLVFLKGGFKSRLKTEERLENVMSVLFINHALFDFASKHSSEYPNVFTWPGIKVGNCKVNPILHARDILERMPSRSRELSRQLSRIVICGSDLFLDFAINSRSEAVLICNYEIMVIKHTGERKDVFFPATAKNISVRGRAIAVDCNDNMYAITTVQAHDGNNVEETLVLYVFEENFDLKHRTTLDVLHAKLLLSIRVRIAVNKNDNIVIIQEGDKHVYICNSKGQLKFQFKRDSINAYSLSITNDNDIIMSSDDDRSVHVYTTGGNLKSTFETPEGHEIGKVAFHHGIGKVIVLTYFKEFWHKSLLCYSETGELEYLEVLSDESRWNMKSYPSGSFAVCLGKCISFI